MRKILFPFIIASLLPLTAFGQKIKVKRVKGNSAVIEFSGRLEQGKSYDIFNDEYSTLPNTGLQKNYSLAGSAEISARRDDDGVSDNTISIDVRAGLNKVDYEFGPLFNYSSNSYVSTTQAFLFGGWYDYNMIANTPGEIFIYGFGALAAFGMAENAASVKQDLMRLNGGMFVKWFPGGGSVGLRFDGGLDMMQASGSDSQSDYTKSGLKLSVGIVGYL